MITKTKKQPPNEIVAEVLEKINDCAARRSKTLDLSSFGLTDLPPELFKLKSLKSLNLYGNSLTSISSDIAELSSLQDLNLNSNDLRSLPRELGQLKKLQELIVQGNHLDTLPPEIGELRSLSRLNLAGNNFTAPPAISNLLNLKELNLTENGLETLPENFQKLKNLEVLFLGYNKFTRLPDRIGELDNLSELYLHHNSLLELPCGVGNLRKLQVLVLSNNQLTKLPMELGNLSSLSDLRFAYNQIQEFSFDGSKLLNLSRIDAISNLLKSLPHWLRLLPGLRTLSLHRNPSLKISTTVLGPNPHLEAKETVSAKSILDFYFGRQAGKNRPLNEVKVIMVGRGGAGKTSTVRALRGLPFNKNEISTPGIALSDWKMEGCKKEPVTAHIWDFAGQVITHALHQFFFSVRSVYVVVLSGRENNEREDAEYWLRLIKAFGTDEQGNGPPVIVALNKWDLTGCRPSVDRGALTETYPFIKGFVEVDCESNRGVAKLRASLCREVDRLNWVREPFPESWDKVRRALTGGRKRRAHLSYAEYRKLCVENGVTDEGQQDSLAEILHHLGAALNYRTDPRLREATVLQPEWLTKNVYGLVRRAEKSAGVLTQNEIDTVLRAEKDLAMRAYLVQIMERFEIAYAPRAKDENGGVWLVPQALRDQQPKSVASFRTDGESTRLRYTYPALPEGLVARAIVRLHEFIEESNGENQQWASGVILRRENARALVRTIAQDRQVVITVIGPTKARQQLAGLCQAEMRDIHAEIRGLDPIEETEVRGTWVATATLELDEKNRKQTGIPTKDRGTIMVDPEEPNNEYSEKLARSIDIWKPTVFISYSKSNVNQRKRLESELKILKNEGLLASHWHDRMIDPGSDWDHDIQKELHDADVVIVLTSSAALSTDYITTHEIPKALELHESNSAVVIPVILEACRWHHTRLGSLNALPEKGRAITRWKPQSDGWNSVAEGLAIVLAKLMNKAGNKRNKPLRALS